MIRGERRSLILPLAAAGVDLTCLDNSPEMLRHLERKLAAGGWTARVVQQDVTAPSIDDTFELALIAFNSFEELVEPQDRKAALRAVHRLLSPEGRLICTLHNPAVSLQSLTPEPRVAAEVQVEDGSLTLELDLASDPDTGIVEGTETVIHRSESGEEVAREELKLRFGFLSEVDFRCLAKEAGFKVRDLFGDYERSRFEPSTSPFMIWVLKR